MVKIIEFGCTHNNARSKHAEAYAVQRLEELAKDGVDTSNFQVLSSGTRADQINRFLLGENTRTDEDVYRMVLDGMRKKVYAKQDSATINHILTRKELTSAEFKMLTEYARVANLLFVEQENRHRRRAFNMEGMPLPTILNIQTTARPDVTLFLGMGEDNISDAVNIYALAEITPPRIHTLAKYATGNEHAYIKSAYGEEFPAYWKMAQTIKDFTRRAIDRAVEELR